MTSLRVRVTVIGSPCLISITRCCIQWKYTTSALPCSYSEFPLLNMISVIEFRRYYFWSDISNSVRRYNGYLKVSSRMTILPQCSSWQRADFGRVNYLPLDRHRCHSIFSDKDNNEEKDTSRDDSSFDNNKTSRSL